jgi:CRISPR-associated protein Cmr4
MSTRLLFVHALSPLHAGTGQSVGAIELAIARDRATGFPYLPGTSLKGALRDRAEERVQAQVNAVFGPPSKDAMDHAGALVFGDANLLLLPARSVGGTFAWVTSPYLLRRFARDCQEAAVQAPAVPEVKHMNQCMISHKSPLGVQQGNRMRVIFEDLDFTAAPPDPKTDPVGTLADQLGKALFPADEGWRESLKERLCVVHDDVMAFLSEHATDVVARVALKKDSKTVENLWHEESLPTESVLVSVVQAVPNGKTGLTVKQLHDVMDKLAQGVIQLGGKSTVGRGRCRLQLQGGQR